MIIYIMYTMYVYIYRTRKERGGGSRFGGGGGNRMLLWRKGRVYRVIEKRAACLIFMLLNLAAQVKCLA